MDALMGLSGGTEEAAVELYRLLSEGAPASVLNDADPAILLSSWAMLDRLGLAEADDVDERCRAVRPEAAIGRLLELCRAALLTREQDICDAVWGTSTPTARRGLEAHVEVEVVAGRKSMAERLSETYRTPEVSRLEVRTDPVPERPVDARVIGELARRGVRMQALYRCRSDLTPAQQRHVDDLMRLGVAVRLDQRPPIDVIIVDRRTVVLPADPARPGRALVVLRSRVWAHVAELMIQSCWQASVPLRLSAGPAQQPLAASTR